MLPAKIPAVKPQDRDPCHTNGAEIRIRPGVISGITNNLESHFSAKSTPWMSQQTAHRFHCRPWGPITEGDPARWPSATGRGRLPADQPSPAPIQLNRNSVPETFTPGKGERGNRTRTQGIAPRVFLTPYRRVLSAADGTVLRPVRVEEELSLDTLLADLA